MRNTATAAAVRCAQFLSLWISAMGWHLGRIATFRPYYAGMADTPFTVLSFAGVYAAAAIFKFSWVEGLRGAEVAFEVFLAFVLITLLSIRRNQSHGLFCALLGSSAIVDILVSVLSITGIAETPRALEFMIVEVCLYAGCLWEFSKAPAAIRVAGYRCKRQP